MRPYKPEAARSSDAIAACRMLAFIHIFSVCVRWRLGHQSPCDCRNTHKDDEELEHRGVAAIWFDGVDSRKQEGGNDADAEGVNCSQHFPLCFGKGSQSKFPTTLALASSCPTEPTHLRNSMEAPQTPNVEGRGRGQRHRLTQLRSSKSYGCVHGRRSALGPWAA
jgi:hypothetical protein